MTGALVSCVAVCGLMWCSAALAQKPPRPPARVASPEIRSDRTVTFRLIAPDARDVQIAGEFLPKRRVMLRDETGVWSVTVDPIEPDIWTYSFFVDGVEMADPSNRGIVAGEQPRQSIFEIRSDTLQPPYAFRDVPHGQVRLEAYRSKAFGAVQAVYMYTPPGYERQTRTRFPVLYLLPGAGNTESSWTEIGKVNLIMDNLLAERKVKPMVVVMPYGYSKDPDFLVEAISKVPPVFRKPDDHGDASAMEQDLFGDVMPLVESRYRVYKDRSHRAIAGASLGGNQSMNVGLRHLDLFSSIGVLSSGVTPEDAARMKLVLRDSAAINRQLHLFWVGCGKQDFLYEGNVRLEDLLKKLEIEHVLHWTDGTHTWRLWRYYLADFLPRLF